jgi:hypothetical protein
MEPYLTRRAEKGVDVVVVSSTGLVRGLVAAGLSVSHAQAAARLFMPHLHAQGAVELPAFQSTRRSDASGRSILRKRASAILNMMTKELDRLCDRAEIEEKVLHVRRGSGLALLNILKAEHQERKEYSSSARFLLSADMRVSASDT